MFTGNLGFTMGFTAKYGGFTAGPTNSGSELAGLWLSGPSNRRHGFHHSLGRRGLGPGWVPYPDTQNETLRPWLCWGPIMPMWLVFFGGLKILWLELLDSARLQHAPVRMVRVSVDQLVQLLHSSDHWGSTKRSDQVPWKSPRNRF